MICGAPRTPVPGVCGTPFQRTPSYKLGLYLHISVRLRAYTSQCQHIYGNLVIFSVQMSLHKNLQTRYPYFNSSIVIRRTVYIGSAGLCVYCCYQKEMITLVYDTW